MKGEKTMNKEARLSIYHVAGCEDWIQINGWTVQPYHNDIYRIKWAMVAQGAVREFVVDQDGDVLELVHF